MKNQIHQTHPEQRSNQSWSDGVGCHLVLEKEVIDADAELHSVGSRSRLETHLHHRTLELDKTFLHFLFYR